MSILSAIKQSMPSLSKAERQIAEIILADPDATVKATTAELARAASVSDPSVSRFCRTLGCNGFPDFKVQLAKSLVNRASFISESISADDTASIYIEKRINANQSALEYIRAKINPMVIESAVKLLKDSELINIYGMGGTAAVAKDTQHKLFRLGIPTVAYDDNLMQRMTAAAANTKTAIILFSVTGRTIPMIEVAKIARKSKAKLIAITNPRSPLAKLVDITIASGDELEDTTIYIPMTTRIIILTIIDILATGLALALGTGADNKMKMIKNSLEPTKLSNEV